MILETKVEKKDEGIVEVQCKIESSYVDKVIQEVTNQIRSNAALKGFRKGKAPIAMIKRIYEGQIKYDALNKILPAIFEEVSKEKGIKVANTPEFSGYENIAEGQDLDFTFVVETMPEVEEMAKLEEIEAEKVEYDYDMKEMVEKEMELLKDSQADYSPIEDTIQEGDFVKVTYALTTEEGEAKEPISSYFIIRDNDPFYALSKNFIGAKLKEEKTVDIVFPEDYQVKELAGKKSSVKFEAEEGKRVIYPEMNDELAKKFDYDTIDALKEAVQKTSETKIKDQELMASADNIYDQLIEKSTFSVAPTFVLQQAQNDMSQKVNQLMMQGTSLEAHLEAEGLSQEDFIEQVKTDAKKNIQKYLLVERIIKDNDIKIEDKDVDAFIDEIIGKEAVNKDKIKEHYSNPQAKASMKEQLKFVKVAEFIIDNVKITGTEKKKLGEN